MIRATHLAAAFGLAAGLTASGAALAQTQTASTPPPPQPASSTSPWAQPDPPITKPSDRDAGQPTYAVDPPPEGSSGVYLPAAVLGYAKSAAGCVVVGCNDGPQGSGAAVPATPGPPPPAPVTPTPANPGSPAP